MSPVHPRILPASGPERQAQRLADLERRLSSVERGVRLPGIQRAYAHAGALGPYTARTTIASVALNVPDASSIVAVHYHVLFTTTNASTQGLLRFTASVDFSGAGGYVLGVNTLGTVVGEVLPVLSYRNAGNVGENTVGGVGLAGLYLPYMQSSPPTTPTPGDQTFGLTIERQAGAGTVSITSADLWVIVL